MRILQLHNHYGSHSGESTVLDAHASLLKSQGHEVFTYTRSSVELESMRLGKAMAFFTALYSSFSIRETDRIISEFRPDLVHIHNLYPLLSPSVLPSIRKHGVPVVMTVHNYRLVCPNGLFYNKRGICERCGGGREWNCLLMNCEESLPKSLGYAARNAWARVAGYYTNHVDAFLCLTEFQKGKLVENGFPAGKCLVLPNFTDAEEDGSPIASCSASKQGLFFIGRLNRQKGVDIIVDAAKRCPEIPFFLAGAADTSFIDTGSFPPNVEWLGVLDENEKVQAFKRAKALVFASRSYEGFPMVFLEAMQQRLPVIAPDLAGYPEIIRHGVNGWLFRPEDAVHLAETILEAQGDPAQAEQFGINGRNILAAEYSSEVWYSKYMEIARHLMKKGS